MKSLMKLFWVSRPVSWLNTAYPFAAAFLVAGGRIDLTFIIGTLFFLGPYNLLMYGINDVFDYESDILNPRKGGIEGMREQRAFHPTIIRASIISTIPFVVYLLLAGTLLSNATLIGLLFFVVAYSLIKLRFKERPVLDSITSSIHFVGPMIYALALVSDISQYTALITAFFLWGMASHALGAIQDIIPDRAGNIHSIATAFGARTTYWFVVTAYTVAAVLLVVSDSRLLIVAIAGMLYVANIAPYYRITDVTSDNINRAWRRFIWLNLITGFIVTMTIIVFIAL